MCLAPGAQCIRREAHHVEKAISFAWYTGYLGIKELVENERVETILADVTLMRRRLFKP